MQLMKVLERLCGATIQVQVSPACLLSDLRMSVPAFLLAMVHVTAFALLAKRVLRVRLSTLSANAAYLTMGYALFGFYVWAAGYVGGLNRRAFLLSSVAAFVFVCRDYRKVLWVLSCLRIRLAVVGHRWPVATAAVLVVTAIALWSGTRGIAYDDDYRWQSAVFWAKQGCWARSPFRLTNGPALSEMLHVPAAIFGSPTAAHWMSTCLWICCALSAAAIGQKLGAPSVISVVAVLSLPVFTRLASVLSSDVTALAFALAAFVFLMERVNQPDEVLGATLAAGLLFAAVLSTKFILLASLPAAIAMSLGVRRPVLQRGWRLAALTGPVLTVACLWVAHTYHLIGMPFDPSGKHMARSADDPMWKDGQAAGRIPGLLDIARLPMEPFVTTVFGQREPYGGRTGLLWAAMLPAAAILIYRGHLNLKAATILLGISLCSYGLLAPFMLKTRFLLLPFALLSVLAAAVYCQRGLLWSSGRRMVAILFVISATVGMFDGARNLLLGLVLEAPVTQAN